MMLEENARGIPTSGRFTLEFLHRVHRNPSHICCNAPDDASKPSGFSPSFPLAYGSHSVILTLMMPVSVT